METVLKGYKRDRRGTKACKKLRKEGKIPAVLYGKDIDTVHMSVDRMEIERLLRQQERLLSLSVGKDKAVPALVQDIQYEPIRGDILHLDFLMVNLDEKIEVDVAVELVGAELTPGVQEGGNLETVLHDVSVLCLPDQIPEALTLDVSKMNIGDTKTVADLELPEGIEVNTEADEIVAAVHEPVDVEAATDIEESLQEIETAEPTVQKQKEPDEIAEEEKEKSEQEE